MPSYGIYSDTATRYVQLTPILSYSPMQSTCVVTDSAVLSYMGFWPTVLSVEPMVHCVVCLSVVVCHVCLSSVTFCIVAKWYCYG